MKKIVFLTAALLILFSSCKDQAKHNEKQANKTTQTQIQSNTQNTDTDTVTPVYKGEKHQVTVSDYDYTAPYICPNHCPGSGSDKPGKCPVCGMDLIPNPDYQKK